MRFHTLPIAGAALIGLLIILISHQMRESSRAVQDTSRRNVTEDRLERVATTLSQSVNVRLNHTKSLAAFVALNRNFSQTEFDNFAMRLQEGDIGIRSLQLAPNGVVEYVTNLESNRSAIGHDLLADHPRKDLIVQPIEERVMIIAGPINLRQGGKAIIARQPLYFTDEVTGEDTFWGFATVLIDIDPLFDDAGFDILERFYWIAVRGKDGMGASGETFYGHEAAFETAIAVTSVELPNGSWQIAAWRRGASAYKGFFFSDWYWASLSALIVTICVAVYLILAEPTRLREAVRKATVELRAARDESEAANLAKSDFMATMSHEFRTPLTAIKGALGLINSGVLSDNPEEIDKTFSMALRNSNRLAALVDDALDFFKIDAGRMEYHMEPIVVDDLVQTAVDVNKGYGDAFSVSLAIEGGAPGAEVLGDEDRLLQVFANLLSNAVKFSRRDSVVKVSALCSDTVARITVADTGPGIPPNFRSRIFEEFSRADSSDTRRTGGTDLGLYISKAIVERHDGRIGFKPRSAGGTKFYFELPLNTKQ